MARLPGFVHEIHELRHTVNEIAYLEEHMSDIADSGRDLLERLLP